MAVVAEKLLRCPTRAIFTLCASIVAINIIYTGGHSSYLSKPPQPAVVYFFLAGVLFSIENAKCWPNYQGFMFVMLSYHVPLQSDDVTSWGIPNFFASSPAALTANKATSS